MELGQLLQFSGFGLLEAMSAIEVLLTRWRSECSQQRRRINDFVFVFFLNMFMADYGPKDGQRN